MFYAASDNEQTSFKGTLAKGFTRTVYYVQKSDTCTFKHRGILRKVKRMLFN